MAANNKYTFLGAQELNIINKWDRIFCFNNILRYTIYIVVKIKFTYQIKRRKKAGRYIFCTCRNALYVFDIDHSANPHEIQVSWLYGGCNAECRQCHIDTQCVSQ